MTFDLLVLSRGIKKPIDFTTYMSYYKSVKFKDFQGRDIELSELSWEHIQEAHPEISIKNIERVLAQPSEVVECARQKFVERFYQVKLHPAGKQRFYVVVVKVLPDGNFISTAMTTATIKKGRSIYRKGDER